jgi:hypothetical protein
LASLAQQSVELEESSESDGDLAAAVLLKKRKKITFYGNSLTVPDEPVIDLSGFEIPEGLCCWLEQYPYDIDLEAGLITTAERMVPRTLDSI